LNGREAHPGEKTRTRSTSWPVLAVVCIVLLALLAVVQVPHLHANQTDADQCPLCIVLHSTVPAAIAAPIIVLVPVGAPTPQVEPTPVVVERQSGLFIRPPPLGC
jgi:hypothetical protein